LQGRAANLSLHSNPAVMTLVASSKLYIAQAESICTHEAAQRLAEERLSSARV
jgi:hypothetical protein